ncbi:homoserine acetyltransferase [Abortiporus biennis]|nr:homoserine acetyltransferase [Abortiporus biennis]
MSPFNFSDSETKLYHHGRFTLAGGTLPDAITAYRTYGDPQNPCIVFPTCFGAKLDSQEYLVGPGKALDPTKYYAVTFALFSNGEPSPYNGPYFPSVTYEDNIRAQFVVLSKALNVTKIYCVVGFSMGGQQAYYWPVLYPNFVERFIAICGSARTSPHNYCFLEGPKAALTASKDFYNGHYTAKPQHGLRAFGRVYSAWAYGQTWFREKLYLQGGKNSDLNNWLHDRWETGFLSVWDANDLLTLLRTWQLGDVSRLDHASTSDLKGDLESVLGKIKAKGLIMPCKTDLYFPPEDSENEVAAMTKAGVDAKLVINPSIWGHQGGGAANEVDVQFLRGQILEFLQ